ncbi:beta-ketoacyl synthase domain-containing protein [Talaromyces proteolyticus]|uniref:Beta-ketoacyl synthase domain-containing protein n=1 Tax=Talaromyces proteolyticus TaxID=1131652 RepID=A0AAD4KM77_9EURO|nr:beta-ketoacyl synthase domain-containing protein [Talaromyces proteolyticus]KAH8694996.1 beta-ketoacyl synthase domain-containing protein [Talaromyces proteolyticus]
MVSFGAECTTKLLLFSHEFPADDVQELFRGLHRHSKGTKFPLLATFLTECTRVLKEEISKLPRELQDDIPAFHSVTTFAAYFNELRKGPLGGAWEGAFLCIYQIAMFIGYFEANDLDYDIPNRSVTVVGMSIGLFAASATAAASSLAELALTGAESVRVSFAFCTHVRRTSDLLETPGVDENLSSWAYVVMGLSADKIQDELDQYNKETRASKLNKLTISHTDINSVGITGPPARLRHLFQRSEVLRYSKHSSLQIHGGLCHVPDIYDVTDVEAIMNTSSIEAWHHRLLRLPLLSPHTGMPFPAENAAHLVELIVKEALMKPLHFDNLVDGILNIMSSPGLVECDVLHFRTSIISKGLISTLESKLSKIQISCYDIVDWIQQEYVNPPRLLKDSKLAIVGMACRMPGGANDHELFWELLVDGRDVHTRVPADRFDLEAHYDPTGAMENSTDTPYGNFIDGPGLFDPGFFNMSPREAEQTDPMQRLALVTAYEALEMAGFVPNRTASSNMKRVGVFFGQASDDYREVNANQNVSTYGIPGTERAFGNGRINYFFKFQGPSFSLDTACSSGLAAVNAACSSLWAGESDLVIAGGLNVITNPDIYCMLTKGHFLSKTGQCKVWDEGADGYCRADGIGSVVIKRLEDAIADNDKILGTIAAGATNHSCDAVSITHPHVGAQKDNYRQVILQAGINPLDVSYVELHGTGTQAGDAVESESVLEIFAPVTPKRRPEQRLHLGAVKSNIGHGEAAAGVASLIKVLLMYQKNLIPRHVGIKSNINPAVAKNLEKRNAGVVFENTPWPRPEGGKRYAIVNSFGAHGGNTTLVLEDPPKKRGTDIVGDSLEVHPITISAKSKVSLKGNIEDLIQYLVQNPDSSLQDLSYTLMVRRIHHPRRISTSVSSISQLQDFLKNSIQSSDDVKSVSSVAPKMVFAFTGQGSFYRGAGQQLFQSFPYFNQQVRQLDHVVQKLGFPAIIHEIEGTKISDEEVVSPIITQLVILVLQIALIKFWKRLGLSPAVVIGHSLGEYAAMVASGVLSPSDAIYLVGKRAELLVKYCKPRSHIMLSVRAGLDEVNRLVNNQVYFEISCLNSSQETVISGPREDIGAIRTLIEAEGLKCLALDIPYAFHSGQLDAILDEFEDAASHIVFKPPTIPIVSPLLGQSIFDGKTINAKYLRRASREPVNFVMALESAASAGIIDDKTIWLEIGSHPICNAFARSHNANLKTFISLQKNEHNVTTVTTTLTGLHAVGLPLRWGEYYRDNERSYNLLHLPHYHWNNENYFIPYTGTWTLEKGRSKYCSSEPLVSPAISSLQSTSVQRVIIEELQESTGHLVAVTDIQRPDFLEAVNGHKMNGRGVVTGSIWGEISLTVGEYLYKRLVPEAKTVNMNVAEMEVLESQLPNDDNTKPQLIQIEAFIDLMDSSTAVKWYSIKLDGSRSEYAFASATVFYEDPKAWKTEWRKITHLLEERIATLSSMAASRSANKLTRNMIYQLFQNIVDYADVYRGMQSLVLNGLEAFADVELTPDRHGSWHTPPHWIDSVFQMAGFVMNGGDETNTREFFYITPGWDDLRIAKPLAPNIPYQSYVRMTPSEDEANTFIGDIYALQSGEIVGVCGGIKFRRVPRVLMQRLYAGPRQSQPVDLPSHHTAPQVAPTADSKALRQARRTRTPPSAPGSLSFPVPITSSVAGTRSKKPAPTPAAKQEVTFPSFVDTNNTASTESSVKQPQDEVVVSCMNLISRETGLDIKEFVDEASFAELGIDSLMSLVLSEKLLNELGVEVKSSIFLECPTVIEFTNWLTQYR